MIADTIKMKIGEALVALDLPTPDEIQLEHPDRLEHGDYASNVAMVLAEGENPRQLAKEITEKLPDPRNVCLTTCFNKVKLQTHLYRSFIINPAQKRMGKIMNSLFLMNDRAFGLPAGCLLGIMFLMITPVVQDRLGLWSFFAFACIVMIFASGWMASWSYYTVPWHIRRERAEAPSEARE